MPLPVWLTVVTLSRDAIIMVSVAVVNLTLGRRVFYPSLLGKLSTASQLVTVGVVLLLNAAGWPLPARALPVPGHRRSHRGLRAALRVPGLDRGAGRRPE